MHNKSGSVFLGYKAGFNETTNNRLYIENSDSSTPLIYGEFGNDIFAVNGSLGVGTVSPDGSALLDLNSDSKGFLLPRLSASEIGAISNPADGLQAYNTDDGKIYVYVLASFIWKEVQYGNGEILSPANYTIGTGGACSNITVNGFYFEGIAFDVYNTVTLDATVTTPGTWSISTNTVNGYGFSGSGTFTTTGIIQITLNGTGTPTTAQTDNFIATPNISGGTCTFEVPVSSAPICGSPIVYAGQSYNTVLIGGQCWMAENLNIGTMINGASTQTNNAIIEKYCYDNSTTNCDTYGGLYQWDEMMQYITTEGTQGVCPTGWHVPTDADWCIMENYVDVGTVSCTSDFSWRGTDAGSNLKETGTSHWIQDLGATNTSGFTALPGGSDSFNNITFDAYFWSSSSSGTFRYYRVLAYDQTQVWRANTSNSAGYSVRCIKD